MHLTQSRSRGLLVEGCIYDDNDDDEAEGFYEVPCRSNFFEMSGYIYGRTSMPRQLASMSSVD